MPMFARFTQALVRPPARNFADGLTTVDLGVPDVDVALEQHAAYCAALQRAGCHVIALPPDNAHPDSTFVEDTALLLTGRGGMVTRPGAMSRQGEVAAIQTALAPYFPDMAQITAPGTLDAGDVCELDHHVLIGISHRTNAEGAAQLAAWLASFGVTSNTIDIRSTPGILHLKSGITAVRGNQLLAIAELASHPALQAFDVLPVAEAEAYAANCVRVNDVVFLADGYPRTRDLLRAQGYAIELLPMSEYAKMDGGLSCLSLRW